jgi:SNF2 family DNA or RNA helicase
MITENTIEERILELQETKTDLTDAVTEGSEEAWVRLLRKADIKRLFYQQQ